MQWDPNLYVIDKICCPKLKVTHKTKMCMKLSASESRRSQKLFLKSKKRDKGVVNNLTELEVKNTVMEEKLAVCQTAVSDSLLSNPSRKACRITKQPEHVASMF